MKQEENIVAFALILFIQRLDPFPCRVEQRFVLGHHLGRGITPIGQQGKMEMLVTVGQITNLQGLDQIANARGTGQHRGHGHQSATFPGNPVGKVHARQGPRGHEQRHQPVDDGHAEVGCSQQNQQASWARAARGWLQIAMPGTALLAATANVIAPVAPR